MSFELKLSKAGPEVQKELKEPGAGRVLRISKGQQGGNCAGVVEGKKGRQRKVLDSACYKDVGFWQGLATCNLSYLAVLGRKITSSRPALDYRVNSRVTWAA